MTETQNTRQKIVGQGQSLMLTSGFAGLGLSTLLKTAGVPKGSFYHWFESKEDFGRAAIEAYVDTYLARLDALIDGPGTASEKLDLFFAAWMSDAKETGSAERCLVVKLGAGVSDLFEPMRNAMDIGVQRSVARLADLLRQGAQDHSLRALHDPLAEARQLYAALLGAAILSRISRDDVVLRDATDDARTRFRA